MVLKSKKIYIIIIKVGNMCQIFPKSVILVKNIAKEAVYNYMKKVQIFLNYTKKKCIKQI